MLRYNAVLVLTERACPESYHPLSGLPGHHHITVSGLLGCNDTGLHLENRAWWG
ncbi:hypothetical protein GCG54_00015185 [Colletotrichum gloeosporioides]|uniref:Uncharacterized protein n=1 Tax=Colletotrichum gloeosporioides TaxID=474922 RepID=A0A8H4FH33_COLGL|nr:uncharacterized protein GCG54_00015185 [Colletotrichum gloeosporioides]KAF3801962.1 hypothetical protein GCG54_00015185 [Colletotrichum gloeosporioides]